MAETKQSEEEKEAYRLGDEYKRLVLTRTGLKERELVCPREKSDMTPCIARDGAITVIKSHGSWADPICVGCERSLLKLLQDERMKHV